MRESWRGSGACGKRRRDGAEQGSTRERLPLGASACANQGPCGRTAGGEGKSFRYLRSSVRPYQFKSPASWESVRQPRLGVGALLYRKTRGGQAPPARSAVEGGGVLVSKGDLLMRKLLCLPAVIVLAVAAFAGASTSAAAAPNTGANIYATGGGWIGFVGQTRFIHFDVSAHTGPQGD